MKVTPTLSSGRSVTLVENYGPARTRFRGFHSNVGNELLQ